MAWLLAFTLVNVALSTGIMLFLARRRETVIVAPSDPRAEARSAASEKELERLQDIGNFFQQMLHSVDTKVADHSARSHAVFSGSAEARFA